MLVLVIDGICIIVQQACVLCQELGFVFGAMWVYRPMRFGDEADIEIDAGPIWYPAAHDTEAQDVDTVKGCCWFWLGKFDTHFMLPPM